MTLKHIEKTNAVVIIENHQTIECDTDCIELETDAAFYQNNGKFYIIYQEETGSSIIKIDGDTVTIKRNGSYSSVIICKEGMEHKFLYHMPYGDLAMCAQTKHVAISLGENGGTLRLTYDLCVDNALYQNDMTITVRKK